ncbi:MAG: hypothetical protein IKP95_09495 [Ruminococcus sp.]|nr:hypothetical protein [Ruminococcus sp.]
MYQNKEHGNILTYEQMLVEASELYDYGDPTNCIGLDEYYIKVNEEE